MIVFLVLSAGSVEHQRTLEDGMYSTLNPAEESSQASANDSVIAAFRTMCCPVLHDVRGVKRAFLKLSGNCDGLLANRKR